MLFVPYYPDIKKIISHMQSLNYHLLFLDISSACIPGVPTIASTPTDFKIALSFDYVNISNDELPTLNINLRNISYYNHLNI